jgi:olefin beta-lactone synthetase
VDAVNANLAARFAERAGRHPDRIALISQHGDRVERVTFGALARRVAALAAGLGGRGIRPGDSVLLFVPMSVDLYVAMLACLHAGATAVFVDAWADRARLDAAVAAARPRGFVGVPRAHLLRLMSREVRRIPLAFIAARGPWSLARLERPEDARPPAEVTAEAPALVTFTTGSTGRPKAAARSHAFLWAQHLALEAHLGLVEADIDMPTLPVFVLGNLAAGRTSVLPDFDPRRPAEIDPERVHAQLLAERVTSTSGSPAFYERLARWCAARGARLPLRRLFTGGAPVLPPLARLLADTVEGEAHVVYGSTEVEPVASIEAREMLAAIARAAANETSAGLPVGMPDRSLALRVIRPCDGPIMLGPAGWSEWDVAPGETGEMIVSGAHVMRGYLDDPASDARNKIREGERVWHRTGDGARLGDRSMLWLMGRVSRRVQREGRTWWGLPAELRAIEQPDITHAAYLGLPDPVLGQRAVLCVETPSGSLSDAAREGLRAALGPIPVDEIVVLAKIPRDPRHASKTDSEALLLLLASRQHARAR